ncbi:MAG: carboxymuconolactone decarboxylase family protein [Proteobacteria bacterium]|nr:carboxymuconolactone decarboxylase family protein [Pseudomonadota bacterium]MDA1324834.1 carboxymuconolactone decarboxylase family protein [Pseudomonadota bacterium]
MSFFKSLPDGAGPGNIFSAYPEIYSHWTQMGEALINGPSPLSPGERELIQAYVSGLVKCRYSYIAHCEAAYARGIERGLIEKIVSDPDGAPVEAKLKPVLAYVKKLTLVPTEVTQADADAVFAAGWDEKALHDVIAVTARMNFMCRIVEGYGFTPMTPEIARQRAEERARVGYVNLYPAMKEKS